MKYLDEKDRNWRFNSLAGNHEKMQTYIQNELTHTLSIIKCRD